MYPHELSGGMKQRVCIAIAICLRPKVIIADEPTSALDVVVQRQVMETLETLRAELGASVILIGHDMGLMAQSVDRLGVMYAGRPGRDGQRARALPRAAAPLHQAAHRQPALAGAKGASARGIPGLTPSLLEPAAGLPVPPALPASDRALPGGGAAAADGAAQPRCGVPSVRRSSAREGGAVTALIEARHVTKVFGGGLFQPQQRPGGAGRPLAGHRGSAADDHRRRGRERQRQDHPRAAAPRPDRADAGRGALSRRGPAQAGPRPAAPVPARRAGHLPGPLRGLQPVLQGRPRARSGRSPTSGWPSRGRRARADRGGARARWACARRRRWGATRTSSAAASASASWWRARCCCARA